MGSYVFDQAWHGERERLRSLEELHDGATIGAFDRVGVGPGWRCLEVGAGAGSVARWLAERVGPTGRVVATDLDPRFLNGDGGDTRPNLEVRRHDILADPPEVGAFDLVHARAVLEHLPAREQALAHLVVAARPGGWIVVEDTYFSEAMAAAIGACTTPDGQAALDERVYRAVAALFEARGARADYGPQLPRALHAAGLAEVGAELHARFAWGGGARDFRRLSLEQMRGYLIGAGFVREEEVARALDLTAREEACYVPMPMVTAWGRRPIA